GVLGYVRRRHLVSLWTPAVSARPGRERFSARHVAPGIRGGGTPSRPRSRSGRGHAVGGLRDGSAAIGNHPRNLPGPGVALGGHPDSTQRLPGFLAQMKALGWGVLAEVPGREIVIGA